MAIVFVSPVRRQRTVFWILSSALVVMLIGGSVIALLPEIKNQLTIVPVPKIAISQDINVNFALVDSGKVKNLEPFIPLQVEFDYVAVDQEGSLVAGKITAFSKEDATLLLEKMGLKDARLHEASTGKTDPFIPN